MSEDLAARSGDVPDYPLQPRYMRTAGRPGGAGLVPGNELYSGK